MNIDRRTATGHLASAAAYTIFGINVVVCRDIATDGGLEPIVLFSIRALVAGVLFWLAGLLEGDRGGQRVPPRDILRLAGAGVLGLFLPQLTFLHAIAHTTPVDLSVMSTTTPIFTMFVAAIFLKEPITWQKAGGVALSFGGILWLILQSTIGGNGASETEPVGIMYCFANYIVFALYLGTCRPLIARYSVVTSMKWMFLFSFLLSVPFALPHLPQSDFGAVPPHVWWEIGFMVFFSTFVAYYLIPVGQQRIRPTLVSMYGYLQPIIAVAVAIWTGMDRLTVTKVMAALLVFGGVWVVNRSRAAGGVRSPEATGAVGTGEATGAVGGVRSPEAAGAVGTEEAAGAVGGVRSPEAAGAVGTGEAAGAAGAVEATGAVGAAGDKDTEKER